jgi:hypothetical protein
LHHGLLGGIARDEWDGWMFERLPIAAAYVNVEHVQQAYRQIRLVQQSGARLHQTEGLLSCWAAVVLTRWLEREAEATSGLPHLPIGDGGLTAPVSSGSQDLH